LRHQAIQDFHGLSLHGGQDVGIGLQRGRDAYRLPTIDYRLKDLRTKN
jgi:hypothetical protein